MDSPPPGGTERGTVPMFPDDRGTLVLAELDGLPFAVGRVFVIRDIPPGARRAGHAARTQHRFLAVVSGGIVCELDDGRAAERYELATGDSLLAPPGTWLEVESREAGTCLLVAAEGPYDPDDYVYEREALAASVSASATRST